MNRLGIIRIVTAAGTIDLPYAEETAFAHTVIVTRANGGFQNDMTFVPYHAIGFMVKIPDGVPTSSEFTGMTKQ